MGVSTDASIAFGFDLGEEKPEAWADDEDFDFEELQAKEFGLNPPDQEWSEETKPLYHKYWSEKNELVKKHPVAFIRHCSGDCPRWIIAVNGTEQTASRGYPVEFKPEDLKVTEEQIAALKEFCQRHGIEWQEPSWLLYSDWC